MMNEKVLYLFIFIHGRLLIFVESLALPQSVAVSVKLPLETKKISSNIDFTRVQDQEILTGICTILHICAILTFLFSRFLTFFSTIAMAACIEVSWAWGAPFSWGLMLTEGMIKLATLLWMTKVQLQKHGDRLR